MRIGAPIFKKDLSLEETIAEHRRLGLGAAYCNKYIPDKNEREEYKAAFREANIVLAEYPAYCINILDTDTAIRQKNIDEICRRLEQAETMGALCCVMHGGTAETGGWGSANRENISDRSFEDTVEIMRSIIDKVKPKTTKLTLEAESYLLPDSPEVYLKLLEAIGREEAAVHLDPVNMIASPRRFYDNGGFIKRCFALLGDRIVSCHAKDVDMPPKHATVRIDETHTGNGALDYGVYLSEIVKLKKHPTLMIEHLGPAELPGALDFIFARAAEAGIVFEGSERSVK